MALPPGFGMAVDLFFPGCDPDHARSLRPGRSLGLDGLLRREESAAGSKNWRIQVAKLVA